MVILESEYRHTYAHVLFLSLSLQGNGLIISKWIVRQHHQVFRGL